MLLCITRDPNIRLCDIAESVGITVGSAQRILADLIEAGTSNASVKDDATAT